MSAAATEVDVSRGERVGRRYRQVVSRPDDERFLSLNDLARSVRSRAERSRTRVVRNALIHVEANRNDPERLSLILPGADAPVAPTHWSFGQLAVRSGAPAAYLRQLPAPLAASICNTAIRYPAEQIKTLETDNGRVELRAVTGPDYGRIYDHELVEAVQKIAGNGTGDTRWKVPGVLDWSTGIYNPRVDITRDTTTLYASTVTFPVPGRRSQPDRGRATADGSPDFYFRGFYCWNSEVGARRSAWRVSTYARLPEPEPLGRRGVSKITIRHSKYAANRFAMRQPRPSKASPIPRPALRQRHPRPPAKIVARTDEDRSDFLRKRGFSKAETARSSNRARRGRPPARIDLRLRPITALARDKAHQDARLDMEGKAKKLSTAFLTSPE